MKKLKKLTLNEIANRQIDEKGLCRIVGGQVCQCGCLWADQGGSSTSANNSANTAGGLNSGNCPKKPIIVIDDPGGQSSVCSNQSSMCSW